MTLLDQGAQEATKGTLDFEADIVNHYASGDSGKGLFRAEHPHNKSVSSAYWDPRGRQIVSTSYDDTLRRKLLASFRDHQVLNVSLSMGYLLACFPNE